MKMVAFEDARPTLSDNCIVSIENLFNKCVNSDPNQRPSFPEILNELEHVVSCDVLLQPVSAIV